METRKDIDDITASTVILKDELQISHDEIDTAYRRKAELSKQIETGTRTMANLKMDTTDIVCSIQIATTERTESIIGDATSYITSHNDKLLHKMETIFAENMQLMDNVTDEYDIKSSVRTAIEINMDKTVTS